MTLEEMKAEAIEKFNEFIKDWTEHNYPHLIDSDDNDGEFFRDYLEDFAEKAHAAGEASVKIPKRVLMVYMPGSRYTLDFKEGYNKAIDDIEAARNTP